jgi:hypothetical protein
MTSLLSRGIAAVRVWIGLNHPAENRMHPSHGWLLPPVPSMGLRALAIAETLSPVPSAAGKRR